MVYGRDHRREDRNLDMTGSTRSFGFVQGGQITHFCLVVGDLAHKVIN